jgi:hypothetical protein
LLCVIPCKKAYSGAHWLGANQSKSSDKYIRFKGLRKMAAQM